MYDLPNWTLIYLLWSSFLTSCTSSNVSNAVQKFIGDTVSRCEQNQGMLLLSICNEFNIVMYIANYYVTGSEKWTT